MARSALVSEVLVLGTSVLISGRGKTTHKGKPFSKHNFAQAINDELWARTAARKKPTENGAMLEQRSGSIHLTVLNRAQSSARGSSSLQEDGRSEVLLEQADGEIQANGSNGGHASVKGADPGKAASSAGEVDVDYSSDEDVDSRRPGVDEVDKSNPMLQQTVVEVGEAQANETKAGELEASRVLGVALPRLEQLLSERGRQVTGFDVGAWGSERFMDGWSIGSYGRASIGEARGGLGWPLAVQGELPRVDAQDPLPAGEVGSKQDLAAWGSNVLALLKLNGDHASVKGADPGKAAGSAGEVDVDYSSDEDVDSRRPGVDEVDKSNPMLQQTVVEVGEAQANETKAGELEASRVLGVALPRLEQLLSERGRQVTGFDVGAWGSERFMDGWSIGSYGRASIGEARGGLGWPLAVQGELPRVDAQDPLPAGEVGSKQNLAAWGSNVLARDPLAAGEVGLRRDLAAWGSNVVASKGVFEGVLKDGNISGTSDGHAYELVGTILDTGNGRIHAGGLYEDRGMVESGRTDEESKFDWLIRAASKMTLQREMVEVVEVKAHLKPEGLGEVTVKLVWDGEKLAGHFWARNDEAAKVLTLALPRLEQLLSQRGHQVAGFEVSAWGSGGSTDRSSTSGGHAGTFEGRRKGELNGTRVSCGEPSAIVGISRRWSPLEATGFVWWA